MGRQAEEHRLQVRFPFKVPVIFTVMGDGVNPPGKASAHAEILDLSNCGIRIGLKGRIVEVGALLELKIPVSETRTTVPALAQVKWIKEDKNGSYQAGLLFIA